MMIIFFCAIFQVLCTKLMLVGGAWDEGNLEVFHEYLNMPGSSHVNLAIITAASDPSLAEENGKYYIDLFTKNKPSGVSVDASWVPIDVDKIYNNKDPKVVNQVKEANLVFFGGGDQQRLMDCFVEKNFTFSPVLQTIMNNYEKGVTAIGGTSAGTTIQSDPRLGMVDGGESFEALRYGPHTKRDPDHPDYLTYIVDGGFGTIRNFMTDTHFSDRGREGRIILLGIHVHANWVIGVDQNTAVSVEDNSHMRIMGESGVFFFDLRQAKLHSNKISDVYATYLTEGDAITFPKNGISQDGDPKITFASYKKSMVGREEYKYPMKDREDIWSSPDNYYSERNDRKYPKEFAIVGCDLCNVYGTNSTEGKSYHSPVQSVYFEKDEHTLRYEGEFESIKKVSFHKMKIEIDF